MQIDFELYWPGKVGKVVSAVKTHINKDIQVVYLTKAIFFPYIKINLNQILLSALSDRNQTPFYVANNPAI